MGQTKDMAMSLREQEQSETTGTQTGVLPVNTKTLLSLNKAAINDLAHSIIQGVAEGTEDALATLIMAKKGLELFGAIEENCKHYVYGKQYEKHSAFGAEIEPAQLGTKYDFSKCNSAKLDQLNFELEKAKKLVTDEQNFLKAINGSATLVDTDTGETYVAYPPVKTATSGYKITLK